MWDVMDIVFQRMVRCANCTVEWREMSCTAAPRESSTARLVTPCRMTSVLTVFARCAFAVDLVVVTLVTTTTSDGNDDDELVYGPYTRTSLIDW